MTRDEAHEAAVQARDTSTALADLIDALMVEAREQNLRDWSRDE